MIGEYVYMYVYIYEIYIYTYRHSIKSIDYLFSHQKLVNGTQPALRTFREAMGGILGEGPRMRLLGPGYSI